MAEIKLRNPPASLRSLGGEPFGRRDYLLITRMLLGRVPNFKVENRQK